MSDYVSRTIAKLADACRLSDRRDYRFFIGDLIRTVELCRPIRMTFGDKTEVIQPTDIMVSRSRLMVPRLGIQFSMLLLDARYDGDDEFVGWAVRTDDGHDIPVAFEVVPDQRLAA